MNGSTVVMESQVDWLTLTVKRSDGVDNLLRQGFDWTIDQIQAGNKPKPWSFKGYSGSHCGPITYGDRPDGAILQISGAKADELFSAALWFQPKCTRIDLQVTARVEETDAELAARAYKQLRALPLVHGRPPKAMIYANTDGGQTCYIGSPASEHRARLYDKWKESQDDHYKNCWRWEVESRGDRANALFESLSANANRHEAVLGYVARWFEGRGVTVPFASQDNLALVVARSDRTDAQRKLRWLEEQVRPTVDWLCLQGHEDHVMMALGLPCRKGNSATDEATLGQATRQTFSQNGASSHASEGRPAKRRGPSNHTEG